MLLKRFYLGCLAHASYMIGDEESRAAVIVDPRRDIDEYLAEADARGLRIERVILTHFHADFVAGHIERHLYSVPIDPISGLQVQGRVPKRLTSQADINYYPALSRDGRKLAWTAHRRGAGFIYQRDVGTTDEEKLTPLWELSAREIDADFVSPDAESVVYSSTEGGGTGSGGSSARTVLACP